MNVKFEIRYGDEEDEEDAMCCRCMLYQVPRTLFRSSPSEHGGCEASRVSSLKIIEAEASRHP